MPLICKVCESANIEADTVIDGRQRFKCIACQTLFFEDGVEEKLIISDYNKHYKDILLDYQNMPVTDLEKKWGMARNGFYNLKKKWESQGLVIPIAFADKNKTNTTEFIPENIPNEKTYKCKKCDYSTTERFQLTSHYSSVHSWHHEGNNAVNKTVKINTELATLTTKTTENMPKNMPDYASFVRGTLEIKSDGSIFLSVTADEIARMNEMQFVSLWNQLGEIVLLRR